MEKGCDMIKFGRPVNEPSCIVLNCLKPDKKVFWEARKKRIAVA